MGVETGVGARHSEVGLAKRDSEWMGFRCWVLRREGQQHCARRRNMAVVQLNGTCQLMHTPRKMAMWQGAQGFFLQEWKCIDM